MAAQAEVTSPFITEYCPGETYRFIATGQETPITSFEWTQLSGPPGGEMTFTNATETSAIVSVNVKGTYTFQYCYTTPRVGA